MSVEWFTPSWLLEVLYDVFGEFDLDPCSPTFDRTKAPVRAKAYYTAPQDGLAHPWHGAVYMNPPYGRHLSKWVEKAWAEVAVGNADYVIGLVPARTDTRWWHKNVVNFAQVIFLQGRLIFANSIHAAPFPSALVFWGAPTDKVRLLNTRLHGSWLVNPVVNVESSFGASVVES